MTRPHHYSTAVHSTGTMPDAYLQAPINSRARLPLAEQQPSSDLPATRHPRHLLERQPAKDASIELRMSLVRLFDTLALDSWRNPFSIFGTSVAADAWLASDTSAFANTYIESRDTGAAYVFSAALPPGVTKEEVRVEVDEGNVLAITGERSVRREERVGDRWHHIERSCATFLGRFHLPEDAAVDGVRAAMDAGVLTVTVPKVGATAIAAAASEKTMAEAPDMAVEAGPAAC